MDQCSDLPSGQELEKIIEIKDPEVGLNGFIVIHTTKLGPALGATRMFPYASPEEALRDAKRLARTMTCKCALADVPHGGAKAVLIGDPETDKTPVLLQRYAQEVNKLSGSFYTGEDVGLSAEDVYYMQQFSDFFIGAKNKAGDSAPYAALGVFYCIQEALDFKYGNSSLAGRVIAIKGIGKTGSELARLVIENGGNVVAADINPDRVREIKQKFPQVQIVEPVKIHIVRADVFAPCALSDDMNPKNIKELGAPIVCGVANNQLESVEAGDLLYQSGILYVPDFLANAGGLINVADELESGGYNKERVLEKISNLRKICREVLETSKQKGISTYKVAKQLAEKAQQNYV